MFCPECPNAWSGSRIRGAGEAWVSAVIRPGPGSTSIGDRPRITPLFLFFGLCVMPPECQLFGTLGCHLCELAEAELMPLVEHGLLVELVDIADSEALFEAYGLRIPVLRRVDTGAELDWPFEAEQVVAFLR